MKRFKPKNRIIAILLCMAILLSIMPASAIAVDLSTEEIVTTAGSTEVISLREENVKHFDMGNGVYQAIAYSHPVHELDSEGNWQDIDFNMSLTQIKGVRAYTNSAGTAFAANYTANQPLMTLSREDTSIAMTLVQNTNTTTMSTQAMASAATVTAELTTTQTHIQTFADAQAATFSNTLLYANVIPGIDLEYIVDPWTVKENIIVNQPASKYVYLFKLDMDGLYPVLQEDGSVFIYNDETDEQEYHIPAPYMYDATGEMSFDVNFTLTGSNDIYYLTVTADASWVNAEDRVFPVVIDPSYVVVTQAVNMDTYINEDAADSPRGSYKFFYVGENEVAYIYMPTPELPIGATITQAALGVHYYYFDKVKSGYVDVTARQIAGMLWAEESLTWNSVVNNYSNYGLSTTQLGAVVRTYGSIGATSENPQLVAFDITSAAQSWLAGTSENCGIGLKYVDTSPNRSVRFYSTEGLAAYRPQMTFQYAITPLYEATVNCYYDNGYSVYYAENHATSESKLRDYLVAIKNRYMELLGLNINISTISYYKSPIDSCKGNVTSENIDQMCTCGFNHTERSTVIDGFKSAFSGNSTTTNVYWSCHKIRSIASNGTENINRSCSSGYSIIMIERSSSYIRDRDTKGVLMHELNHQYGARDHYHELADLNNPKSCKFKDICSECGTNPRSEACIMYDARIDISADTVICEGCRNDIESHLENHH